MVFGRFRSLTYGRKPKGTSPSRRDTSEQVGAVASDYIARGGPDSNGFASAESTQRGRSPAASFCSGCDVPPSTVCPHCGYCISCASEHNQKGEGHCGYCLSLVMAYDSMVQSYGPLQGYLKVKQARGATTIAVIPRDKLTTPEKKPFGDKVRLKPGEVGW